MIKEFEKQIMLTEKTNELLEELKLYTKELRNSNEENLFKIKSQIETDIQEIVDYCIKMGIPKNKTGWTTPSEDVVLKLEKDSTIRFKISYDTRTEKHEWYIGYSCDGIGYAIRNGLFCTRESFSNYNPIWSYGFLSDNNTESRIVQYICSNWNELKTKIIDEISKNIAMANERKIKEASEELEKRIEDLISSNKELNK